MTHLLELPPLDDEVGMLPDWAREATRSRRTHAHRAWSEWPTPEGRIPAARALRRSNYLVEMFGRDAERAG